ncbi:YHS domain-containing (seleno)protein [Candidatus Uabimicrobium helgolandensis]
MGLSAGEKKDFVRVDNKKIAVDGYDVVAYFVQKKPAKGQKKFLVEWNGAKWLFKTKENLQLFKKTPQKYAPQFGGFCAWAVGNGYTAKIDPLAWKVVDKKLYLNYNKDIQKKWQKDMRNLIKKGHENWPTLAKKHHEEKSHKK